MDIIRFFIHKPVTVTVGVILTVMFGLIGFQKLPVQLTPDVETPLITDPIDYRKHGLVWCHAL